ncbi:hypothetical protein BBJ28_00027180 [Nothophytophthora sp. Chile5]|nr:hypothetical protein BBJ28_00027180 [Nothophytophthora sp. Chile5]
MPRKKSAAIDDVVLLRAVNAFRPWRAPIGTSNGIMKVFNDIDAQCKADPELMVSKQGATLRTRFSTLVREYKNDQRRSMHKPGTVEQYKKRECLLQDIIAQMGDWQEQINAKKGDRDAKQQAIESSGELLRRLAMGELEDDSKSEEDESSTTEALATEDTATDSSKCEYKVQRLKFEREQAERQRQHEADEAAKRRQHELELDAQRRKAGEEREKRMFDFLMTVLYQKDSGK